jgi:hypothetical protein
MKPLHAQRVALAVFCSVPPATSGNRHVPPPDQPEPPPTKMAVTLKIFFPDEQK